MDTSTAQHEGLSSVLHDCCGNFVHCKNQQALDLYNQGQLEYVRYYGNCKNSFEKALEVDDEFFLINCMLGCLRLLSNPPNDSVVVHHLAVINRLTPEQMLPREKFHVDAFKAYASGDLPAACVHWEACIFEYPKDIQALWHLYKGRVMLGQCQQLRDTISAVMPYWSKTSDHLYPYVLALYSFALEETGRFKDAEVAVTESLEMVAHSPFAIHTLAHLFEEDKDTKEGIKCLTSNRNNWEDAVNSHHISWHLCLYYFDIEHFDVLLKEYDSNIACKVTSDNLLAILDSSSLLWRLHCLGVDVGDRWDKVQESSVTLIGSHVLSWFDVHLMMSLAHTPAGSEATAKFLLAEQLIKSLQQQEKTGENSQCKIANMVGIPVCQALMAYGKKQFEEVVTLLYPLRYNIAHLGGSRAQRYVITVTLIHAAINSHQLKLALSLIAELKATKPRNHGIAVMFEKVKQMIDNQ